MKRFLKYATLVIVAMSMMTSCSKEEGITDGVTVKGTVKYTDGNAAGAFIYITYGTTDATTDYDQVTVADASGNYHFDGLNKGDYFVDAVYTNDPGIEFNTPGHSVVIGGANDEVTLDITLK